LCARRVGEVKSRGVGRGIWGNLEGVRGPAERDGEGKGGGSTRRFDLTRLVPGLLAAAAASKPWSERALRDVTMFTAESAC
ncbi:hypothetical protein IXO189_10515, partial [Xanthomonas oryzae pv. oryzae]